jgi:hypothetical protein
LSAGRDRSDEGGQDADHLTHQFLIGIQKPDIENISRTDGVAVWTAKPRQPAIIAMVTDRGSENALKSQILAYIDNVGCRDQTIAA